MVSTTLAFPGDESPFDKIRRIDAFGREYWSARELMPFLGYSKWHNFARVIEQAMTAAGLSGVDLAANFPATGKVSGSRGPSQVDYELSRYGAYLTAMRGDSHKQEIADALTYFAVRTHQAETAQPNSELELAKRVIELQDRVSALLASNLSLTERAAVLSAKAEGYDDLIACEGVFTLEAAAKILGPATDGAGPDRFINMLRGMEILYQRSKLPRQEYITRGYFGVRTEAEEGKAHPVTVVTLKGLSWLQAEFREERPTLTRAPQAKVVQLPQQRQAGELA